MDFKFKFLFLFVFSIFLISQVSAVAVVNYTVNYALQEPNSFFNETTIPVNGATVGAHYCLNSNCDLVDPNPFYTYTAPSNSNTVKVVYPTTLVGDGYAIYVRKQGLIGWERFGITYAGSGSIVSPNEIYLSQKREKQANLTNFNFVNYSNCANVSVDVVSPISDVRYTNNPLLENVSVDVSFKVLENNSLVSSSSTNLIMEYSEIKPVSFTFCGFVNSSEYNITITSDIPDQKIINSITDLESYSFIFGTNQTNNTCTINCNNQTNNTSPTITILNPLNQTYNSSPLNLEVVGNQTMDFWIYSLNGNTFVSFTPNTIITPQNGTNHLVVYANNSNGLAFDEVYFTYTNNSNGTNGCVVNCGNNTCTNCINNTFNTSTGNSGLSKQGNNAKDKTYYVFADEGINSYSGTDLTGHGISLGNENGTIVLNSFTGSESENKAFDYKILLFWILILAIIILILIIIGVLVR